MSTHEYRVRKRAERAAMLAAQGEWAKRCLAAGFKLEEVGKVTIRDLHEKEHGPVRGRSIEEAARNGLLATA